MLLNSARLYMYSALSERAGGLAEHLCAKYPVILAHMGLLSRLFPKAKFVYMVRDPRAQVTSHLEYLNRTMTALNRKEYLFNWNEFNSDVYHQCVQLGRRKCLTVHYEKLVLRLKDSMKRVVSFLNVTWTEDFLHHEKFVGGEIRVAEIEWSTPQIKLPVYAASLLAWQQKTRFLPREVHSMASFYQVLGYNLTATDYSYLKDL
jgi:protein-tyrosine sulfotransferase